ncbi:MAG TPA: hypothetical protein VMV81_12110, partial [Phycisphaerae bacterium]|nr:hypothetical protein [Phycisphaerae bacterium]
MRSTRLEFLIVTIAFVILLLCSHPPKSGDAQTSYSATSDLKSEVSNPKPETSNPKSEMPSPRASTAEPQVEVSTKPAPSAAVNIAGTDRPLTPKPLMKRMASVDARKCRGLNYPEIMYGEVTASFVWDGRQRSLHKVCVVKNPDGTATVWDFDNPGDAVITEI